MSHDLIPLSAHINGSGVGRFVVVEGNIGVGKSTFCDSLTKHIGERARFFPEPVDKPAFGVLLRRYYSDPSRWGFPFQMFVLKERFRQHTLASELVANGIHVIQDRSIYADGCFGRLVHADGNMSDEEWDIYADTFGCLKRFLRYPDLMIYLRARPESCHKRILARARDGESAVSIDYLRRLHDKHEELIAAMSRFTRVLTFDWEAFPTDISREVAAIHDTLAEDVRFMRDFNRL